MHKEGRILIFSLMSYSRHETLCPVCKQPHNVRCVHVPLGHGRYSTYRCYDCYVEFEWGANKFGDIYDTNQVKSVVPFEITLSDPIKPADHAKYQPDYICRKCGKDISTLWGDGVGRCHGPEGVSCSPNCQK
jgi:hypothetical protein